MSVTAEQAPGIVQRPDPIDDATTDHVAALLRGGSFDNRAGALRSANRNRNRVAAYDLDADTHVCRIHRQLTGGQYRPGPYRVWSIRDPKTRVVAAPSMDDRVAQRALLDDIGPVYERGFIDQSYAVGTGRGPQRAVLTFLKWLRRYRYRLSLDIRRYFLSVDLAILHGLFARRLDDPRTLELIASMLAEGSAVYRSPVAIEALGLEREPVLPGRGLPLGGYLSHWSGGLYLDGLDHHVKRVFKIPGYLRYMDDFSLFADDRGQLEDAHQAIREWLASERKLALKSQREGVRPTSQAATVLGFRVSRSGVLPGPKAKRRLERRLRAARSMGVDRLARSLQAYRGMMLSL